ncbi:MAG: CBS domain-containing protein [Alphaproteobacteria bacterium]|nr:CBS domain-containing protein [Alphaproteobacteria bacterium]
MPCSAAMIDKALILSPDTEIEKALKEMKKRKVEYAAVVGDDGVIEGVFSIGSLIRNILPVSVVMAGGIQMDVKMRAAPGIAKRLRNVYTLAVSALMDRNFTVVYPQTPIWEGVSILAARGSPVFVVEGENNRFIGMMTSASALEELQRMQEVEA